MNRTRITASLPIVFFCTLGTVLIGVFTYFLWRDGFESLSIGHLSGIFGVICFGYVLGFPNKIIISDDHILVLNFPIFSTNSFYKGKADLIKWNTMISFSEIQRVELVNLTPDERRTYYGAKTILNQFLKIDVKGSDRSKFIYVSIYSKRQYEKLLNLIRTHAGITISEDE